MISLRSKFPADKVCNANTKHPLIVVGGNYSFTRLQPVGNHEVQEYSRCDSRSICVYSNFVLELKISIANKEYYLRYAHFMYNKKTTASMSKKLVHYFI